MLSLAEKSAESPVEIEERIAGRDAYVRQYSPDVYACKAALAAAWITGYVSAQVASSCCVEVARLEGDDPDHPNDAVEIDRQNELLESTLHAAGAP